MAIIKCKMCGGDIELTPDKTFGTCEFCGSTMTLPKVDDDQRAAAFNRGNHFRRIGEFDKALAVYERIVREDDTDAEAHWCCALCRFGIEYVEDPATYEYLPTCHRASFDSFLEDVDYLAAVEHSDGITRRQYQKDAARIAEVQRGILATSQNAEPYDVFICYKESDENGNRTRDSLLAQDIYYQLTEQGRKVFFARITLEDVVGTQYEPYIFAALNSAKVMVVLGTKPEYLNAVWVKNEWSRFLVMMKKDRHKLLLPCYRDMDPYDMPEQLSVLQSYDMGKIGFIQDLTRGIAKVLDVDKKPEPVKETVVVQQTGGTSTAPLLKRAFMFLEDGEWERADDFCEQVLNIDPECAEAYLGKLMAELCVRKQDDLRNCDKPFDGKNNYRKVMRFGDSALREMLTGCTEYIKNRNEHARLERIYHDATGKMKSASCEKDYNGAAALFRSISTYRDAAVLAAQCSEKAEAAGQEAQRRAEEEAQKKEARRKQNIYDKARKLMSDSHIPSYQEAIKLLESLSGWRDSEDQIAHCRQRIKELEAREERERQEAELRAQQEALQAKKKKTVITLLASIVCVAALALLILISRSSGSAPVDGGPVTPVFGPSMSKVAVFWYSEDDSFDKQIRTALGAELDALGFEHDHYFANWDQPQQLAQVADAIADGADLLMVDLVDYGEPEAAEDILAVAGDIPIIFFNRAVGMDGSDIPVLTGNDNTCYIGFDETRIGVVQGQMIADYVLKHYDTIDLNGDGYISYAMMMGDEENRAAQERTKYSVQRANEVLADAGKPALLYFDASNPDCYQVSTYLWSAVGTMENMDYNLVSYNEANGNMIELVICNNDSMAEGVVVSLQTAGYNVSGAHVVPVFGIDGTEIGKEMIADGVMAGTVIWSSEDIAHAMAQTVSAIRDGKTPPEAIAGLTDERFSLAPDCASKLYVAFIPYTGE